MRYSQKVNSNFYNTMCYSMVIILLKIQFGNYNLIDNRYETSNLLNNLKINIIDEELLNKVLIDELEKEIINIEKIVKINDLNKIKREITQSISNLFILNSKIKLESYCGFISDITKKLFDIFLKGNKKEKMSTRVKLMTNKLPKIEYEKSIYHLNNIINSDVVDNLNAYYEHTVQLLNKEKKDDEKLSSLIGEIIGNIENNFIINFDVQCFPIYNAIVFYIDCLVTLGYKRKMYTSKEIELMLS